LMFFKDDAISVKLLEALRQLEWLECRNIDIPAVEMSGAHRTTVSSVEAHRFHQKWVDERSSEYFPDVLRVLLNGREREERYSDALNGIDEAYEAMAHALDDVQLIITPTVLELPPRIDDVIGNEFAYRRLLAITSVFNATRTPSISIPIAVHGGFPVSVMINCDRGKDAFLLEVAERLENEVNNMGRQNSSKK
ncbi:MAG: amidase family protein, partial [Methanomassiliicoccales archaeon]